MKKNILSKVATTNPYFRNTTLPYGWDNNLFTPSSPTYTVTDGTLENMCKAIDAVNKYYQ